ncbi:MAG TPA: amidohydrolase family protein, partial [Anaerolineales bacterium]
KMDTAIEKIHAARAQGLRITADMYTYTAGGTGLDAAMPRWVQGGGHDAWVARLKDPQGRERLKVEIETPSDEWENVYLMSGSPDRVILMEFENEELKPLTGKTLAEVCRMRGTTPAETIMDLVVEDNSRVGIVYFIMAEENLAKELRQPWVSLCSDAGSIAAEGVFLKSGAHPRTYGSFARLLAKYVREEKVLTLEEAVRRMTSLPAANIRARSRGWLKPGYFADVVVFDPATIQDHASYEKPHQYATGVQQVFVNGVQVLEDGQHTGAKPGKIERIPQAVAGDVRCQHHQGEHHAGENCQPPGAADVGPPGCQHRAPFSRRRLRAEAEEAQACAREDRPRNAQAADDDNRGNHVWQDMAEDDAKIISTQRARGLDIVHFFNAHHTGAYHARIFGQREECIGDNHLVNARPDHRHQPDGEDDAGKCQD